MRVQTCATETVLYLVCKRPETCTLRSSLRAIADLSRHRCDRASTLVMGKRRATLTTTTKRRRQRRRRQTALLTLWLRLTLVLLVDPRHETVAAGQKAHGADGGRDNVDKEEAEDEDEAVEADEDEGGALSLPVAVARSNWDVNGKSK
jgi:hypothetical protein